MLSRLFGIVIVLAFANQSLGFEVGAVIRKIDSEKRIAHVFANGKERTVKVADNVKVLNEDGKELPEGLAAKELKKGTTVTLRVERDGPTVGDFNSDGVADSNGAISPPWCKILVQFDGTIVTYSNSPNG